MIIVMAGLSGSGKSTIAVELAEVLGGTVLSKDALRAAAFPERVRDYSAAQDDLVMEMVYSALHYLRQHSPQTPVVIDGRTFSKRAQVHRLFEVTDSLGVKPRMIDCMCDDETARQRLQAAHPAAANRDFELYTTLKREADPLTIERLTLDTGRVPLSEAVRRCLEYLREQ